MTIPQSGYIIQRPRHWWQNRRSGWEIPMSKRAPGKLLLVGGLEHLDYFSTYWEFHHPNWLSYFSEGLKPPTSIYIYSQMIVPLYPHNCWLIIYFKHVEITDFLATTKSTSSKSCHERLIPCPPRGVCEKREVTLNIELFGKYPLVNCPITMERSTIF